MIEIRSILCPLDLSDISAHVLDYATLLARWYKASLTAIEMVWVGLPSVRPVASPLVVPAELLSEYEAELRTFVNARTPGDLHVKTVLREGPMVNGILEQARIEGSDLIVMGTHGRGGFDRFVLGSVTEKVLRKAACPVFVVPPRAVDAPSSAPAMKTILCPVDFSTSSLRGVAYALSLAQESGGRLVLLHVFDGPDRKRDDDDARGEMRASVPGEARIWCDCEEVVRIGRPYEEILRLAEERRADLIVMGVHGRNAADLALFGSTTNHVVRQARCPVLTIRP
jgi:nucleotide-binding universal stress UspA family protein